MAWRRITEADLAATISQRELDAYRRSPGADGADPVDALLARTAAMVRGYCRANTAVSLSADPLAVPDSLVSAAADYAAYDILKRMPVPVNEDRRKAREAAVALFEAVASNKMTPESDGSADSAAARAASPLAGDPAPPRMLD